MMLVAVQFDPFKTNNTKLGQQIVLFMFGSLSKLIEIW